jgi:glucosamine--fructose-6-phosphate aminotransferase (isomerizing)
MCGIVGYIGNRNTQEVLIQGLRRLEYRGYDSAGVAVLSDRVGPRGAVCLQIKKRAGKLSALEACLNKRPLKGRLGISHVRWATHGIPNTINAHPHCDCHNRMALVHNGIIENYEQLKESLQKAGHKFRSQTDTEVLVHLIEKFYQGTLEEAVRLTLQQVRGAYAIAVICKDEPEKLVGARLGSPLIAGQGANEGFLASDIPALLDYTNEVVLIDDGQMVVLTPGGLQLRDCKTGKFVTKEKIKVNWSAAQAEKEGFPHFMLKEIHEQPRAMRNTLMGRIAENKAEIILPELKSLEKTFAAMEKIVIISCGTAWHAGLVGKYMLEENVRLPVEVDISSEFRYRNPIIDEKTLVLAITQSGETADTLAGIREAKTKGAKILSVCNVLGSSIPRESDAVIYTHAGPEIAVASTKAYTCQLTVLYLLSLYLAKLKNTLSATRIKQLIGELEKIPQAMEKVLENKKIILQCARRYYHSFGFLYLGRSFNFPTALEGALKIKEISYIHAEGYGAGEMKHGPIALINPHLPVVCIVPASSVHEKMFSNIQEIKARRGIVISVASEGDNLVSHHSNHVIYIPRVRELFSPLLTVLPLQLLAYYIAVKRGCDVDQPKNLAKSVTVE